MFVILFATVCVVYAQDEVPVSKEECEARGDGFVWDEPTGFCDPFFSGAISVSVACAVRSGVSVTRFVVCCGGRAAPGALGGRFFAVVRALSSDDVLTRWAAAGS